LGCQTHVSLQHSCLVTSLHRSCQYRQTYIFRVSPPRWGGVTTQPSSPPAYTLPPFPKEILLRYRPKGQRFYLANHPPRPCRPAPLSGGAELLGLHGRCTLAPTPEPQQSFLPASSSPLERRTWGRSLAPHITATTPYLGISSGTKHPLSRCATAPPGRGSTLSDFCRYCQFQGTP